MACIFHDKPCVFSDKAEAPKKSPQKATKNKRVPGRKPNRIRAYRPKRKQSPITLAGKGKKKSAAAYPQRIKSERGDSNARPLRPERSALPTALLSVLRMQSYEKIDNIIASANFFTKKFARY